MLPKGCAGGVRGTRMYRRLSGVAVRRPVQIGCRNGGTRVETLGGAARWTCRTARVLRRLRAGARRVGRRGSGAGGGAGAVRGEVRDGCERRCGVCGAGDAGIPGGLRGESLWRGQGLRRGQGLCRGQGRFQILGRDAVIPAGMGARMTSSRRQRHEVWPRRLAWSRTLPFHGSDMGSNPIGVTSLAFAGVFCFSTESHAATHQPHTIRAHVTSPQRRDFGRDRNPANRGRRRCDRCE